jgi:putative endonuclease
MYYVYILYSESFDRYYVGHCEEIHARLNRHNSKAVPSTKPYLPWKLVYHEEFSSRSRASARELEIKNKKSRKYIEFLINNGGGTPKVARAS